MTRSCRVPLTATKSNIDRCCTISQSPTPPACGHTGTPNFAASKRIAMFSVTPATRLASSWRMSTAPACSNWLNITALWVCSPVATLIGATARRIAAWPSTSSGEVGSSIQYGSNSASGASQSMACPTPHAWLASMAILMSGPTTSRASRSLRTSSSRSAPTLSLIWVNPSVTASAASAASFSWE